MDGNRRDASGARGAIDSRLDFFSCDFDAALALSAQSLQPPNPKVRPLDYLSKCRALLPAEDSQSRGARMAVKPRLKRDEMAQRKYEETRSRIQAQRARQEQKKQQGTALQRIAGGVPEGPLSLLRRAMQRQQSVRVVTRHARGVRGIAVGKLVGFDGHMNLILRDVKEDYTVRLRIERTKIVGHPTAGSQADEEKDAAESGAKKRGKVEKSRAAWKQEQRTRQLHQALLRGSSVVMVSVLLLAGPQPPRPSLDASAPAGTHSPLHPPSAGVLPLPSAEADRQWARQRDTQTSWSEGAVQSAAEVLPPPPPEPPPPPPQSS